ncbi:MAG TPA: site-specific integrase, partial [Lachnospiraceae bacterium]|nr:site-specific integrase [Lachnospiraceae bacterium]
ILWVVLSPAFIINVLSSSMSPKTVRDYNGLIIAVMNRYFPKTKINTVLPKKQHVERYIPTADDIKKLVSIVNGTEMEVPVYLGAFAMMRRGEIAALNKSDIENNIIHVNKTMVYSDKNEWIIKSPKSYAGDRFIPVPTFVVDAFMALSTDGIEMTPNIITSRFEHVIRAAGLKHFRFHDLRHYCASIQHALGIPDAYIMQAGGWGDDRILKDVYRHTLEDTKKKMSNVAISYFESMQHEMQHEIEKAP